MAYRDSALRGLAEISEYMKARADIADIVGVGKEKVIFDSWYRATEDALAMLKEQEPVTMKPDYFNYVCSGCGSEIDGEFIEYTGGKIKFCPWCGRAVKWDD